MSLEPALSAETPHSLKIALDRIGNELDAAIERIEKLEDQETDLYARRATDAELDVHEKKKITQQRAINRLKVELAKATEDFDAAVEKERMEVDEKAKKDLRADLSDFSERLISEGVPARAVLVSLRAVEMELCPRVAEFNRNRPEAERLDPPGWDVRYSPPTSAVTETVKDWASRLRAGFETSNVSGSARYEEYEVQASRIVTDGKPAFIPQLLHHVMELPAIRRGDPVVSVPPHLRRP